jgi:hypothetical protein
VWGSDLKLLLLEALMHFGAVVMKYGDILRRASLGVTNFYLGVILYQ